MVTPYTVFARWQKAAAAFREAQAGNVAIIFSMTLVPVIFLAGAAVDYSGAANLQAKLQRATDGANMQLCQLPASSSQAQLEAAAQKYLASYMEGRPFRIEAVLPTINPRQIQLTPGAEFSTAIVRAASV